NSAVVIDRRCIPMIGSDGWCRPQQQRGGKRTEHFEPAGRGLPFFVLNHRLRVRSLTHGFVLKVSEGRDTGGAAPRPELAILEDTGTDLALRDITVHGIKQTGTVFILNGDRELSNLSQAAVAVVDAPAGHLPRAWQDVIQEVAIVAD